MTVEGAAGIFRRRLQSLGVKGKHRITLAFSWARTPLAPRLDVVTEEPVSSRKLLSKYLQWKQSLINATRPWSIHSSETAFLRGTIILKMM